jgi:hypothetical protein
MVAAVTDPYVSVTDFKAWVGKTGAGDDTELAAQVVAASRFIDRECGRFFTQDAAAVVRPHDGNGLPRLYVTDIASLTGLVVKVDLDADFGFAGTSETLTIGTHFWAEPANALLGPEPAPYTFLDIVPANGRLDVWPEQPRSVQVTAVFGWPAVPAAIKEATVDLVRKLRDIQGAGAAEALQNIDVGLQMAGRQSFIFQDMRRQYRRGVPFA